MKIVKAFIVAFSMYSKIPMPSFKWNSEDMKYHLIFFPWIGLVIGGLEYLWYRACYHSNMRELLFCAVAILIPVIITGGFHLDGFMDTCDALNSYGDRAKKLEILKDPHIGAFSVISLAAYLIAAFGFISEITEEKGIYAIVFCFAISRCISGICVLCMRRAKSDGMLSVESETAGKKVSLLFLVLQLVILVAAMLLVSPSYGTVVAVAMLVAFIHFKYKSEKEFSGITGDLAGYFVAVSELLAVIFVCIWEKVAFYYL